MDVGCDTGIRHGLLYRSPIRRAQNSKMANIGRIVRANNPSRCHSSGNIVRNDLAALGIPSIQILKFYTENRRLNLVHSAVSAERHFCAKPLPPSILPETLYTLSEFLVIRDHSASIADSAKILGRIEAECSDISERACLVPVTDCAMGLCAILQYSHIASSNSIKFTPQTRDIGDNSIKMGRYNYLRTRPNSFGN